jgi:hypothetical protein
MGKRTKAIANGYGSDISWNRVRAIFGNPSPPSSVWERQFDYFDEELHRLANTPYDEIDFSDLWYYHHDLAHVELQPELFNYLFPVCLMDWHDTLMRNQSCSHGDSEFHNGLVRGKVLSNMLTELQRSEVGKFFRDSFLKRLDVESELRMTGSRASAHGWMQRFNSLGIVMPIISDVWKSWWQFDSMGRAISAIQYLSGLIYYDVENPVFDMWTPEQGGGGPYLWSHDSYLYDAGWLSDNVDFLAGVLNFDFVSAQLQTATAKLEGHSAHPIAKKLLNDLPDRKELVELRSIELPKLLQDPRSEGWSV